MAINRRKVIRNAGLLGAAGALGPLAGCGDDLAAPNVDLSSLPPLPEGLPEYNHSGAAGPETLFQHGVASGDPTPDAVILWTRVSPAGDGPVEVFYEVALDETFAYRVAAGTVATNADRDYTVKIDQGGLKWGRQYYYRFHAQGRTSTVGRTRLAPKGDAADHLRFAVCSCASYPHGYYHAYRWIGSRSDLDAVFHLGDYMYEYGNGGYAGGGEQRTVVPDHETVTLDDYRQRYGHYRKDPDLQFVHARHPFVCIWDDHESTNDSYEDGAQNHQPDTEGDWEARKAASRQAYMEWLPVRDPENGSVYRAYGYGDLADVVFLDTRLAGRDEQIDLETLEEREAARAEAIANGEDPDDAVSVRHLLGAEQEEWLEERLAASNARWVVLAQQVMMGQLYIGEDPINLDQWDGYPGARERVLSMIDAHAKGRTVVLTGDIHSSWANEVAPDPFAEGYDRTADNRAVEFVCPGITSPGIPGLGEDVAEAVRDLNPHIRFANTAQRGYFILDLKADRVQADWYLLDGIDEDEGIETHAAGWVAQHGTPTLAEAAGPAVPEVAAGAEAGTDTETAAG